MQTTDDRKKRKTRRRGNGEGSIFQRSDGRWVATINVGRNSSGKRIRKTVYGPTKKAVQDKLTELHGQKRVGALAETSRMTVGQYLDHWLGTIKDSVRCTTLTGYTNSVKLHLKPHIGGIRLQSLTALHVEAMVSALKAAKKSPRTIRYAVMVLKVAVNRAVLKKLLPYQPIVGLELPVVRNREVVPFSASEAQAILKAAENTRWHALLMLAFTTGMRQGELFGLKWSDVDLAAGVLTIRRALLEVKGKRFWGEPKTESSRRRIELPECAVDALRTHRAAFSASLKVEAADVVFTSAEGSLLGKANFRATVWVPIVEAAGVKFRKFHTTRHTSASMLLALGESIKVVQSRLGHSTAMMTLNTYGHLMAGQDRAAADRLGSELGSKTA